MIHYCLENAFKYIPTWCKPFFPQPGREADLEYGNPVKYITYSYNFCKYSLLKHRIQENIQQQQLQDQFY